MWVGGLCAYPEYNDLQKVRTHSCSTYEGWLPDLSDRATLSYLTLLFIEAGGTLSKKRGVYTLNGKHTSKKLSEIIGEALLEVWGD